MKSQQLLIAITLAETMSITKAAHRLYISQPGVSSSLKSLEDEIGFAIFDRTNKGLVITPKGIEFMRCARSILKELHQIEGIAKSEARIQIKIVSVHSRRVEKAFARLCAAHREDRGLNLSLSTQSTNVKDAIGALCGGKADMVISYYPSGIAGELESRLKGTPIRYGVIGSFPIVLTASKDHALSTEELTPERISAETYVQYCQTPEPGFIDPIYYRVTPKSIISVESRELRLALLSAGIGCSVGMPINKEELERYGLVSRPISDALSDLCYLTSEDENNRAIVSEFLELLGEEYAAGDTEPSP